MKSKYSCAFQSDDAVKKYEEIIYNEDGYDSFIWSIQKKKVLAILESINPSNDEREHLDFACGTGRVLSTIETMTAKSTGVDISPQMISRAQERVKHAKLVVGDILEDPRIIDSHYDLITAFRFFLNAEPFLRTKIMGTLASRLRDSKSRLIFNIQGNRNSLRHFSIARRIKRGEIQNEMSIGEVTQLVEQAGMEVTEWYGIGVCPPLLHKTKLSPFMKIIDTITENLPIIKMFSYDLLFVCKRRC